MAPKRQANEGSEELSALRRHVAELESALAEAGRQADAAKAGAAECERIADGLRESEQKYRALAENTNDIIYSVDPNGVLTYVSPQVERYGFTPSEVVSRSFLDFVVPEDRERVRDDFQRSIATGEEFLTYFRMVDGKGVTFWLEDRGRMQRDSSGRIVGMTGVLRDITEQKRAEEALRKIANEHGMLFAAVPVGIYRTTPDGRILVANSALIKMLGYSSFEDLGRRNLEKEGFEPGYPRSWFKELVGREGSVVGLESVWLTRRGSRLHVRESAVVVRDEKGNVLYYEGIVEDITDQKRAEESVRKAHAKLVSAREEERRRLAAELHDSVGQGLIVMQLAIRNIIAAAEGKADAEHMKRCLEVAERCGQLAQEVRQIGHGLYPPTLESLGLVPSLLELVSACEHAGIAADVKSCEALGEARLPADVEITLFRIAHEAVNNALRHSGAKHVELSLDYRDGWVGLSIVDDGIGFDVASADAEGLGLNSMNERAHAIGGKLRIISKKGKTRVQVRAPAKLRKL